MPEASSSHSLFSDILLPYLNGDTERSADRGGGLRGVVVLERGVGVLDLRLISLTVAGDCVAERDTESPTSNNDFHFLTGLFSNGSPISYHKKCLTDIFHQLVPIYIILDDINKPLLNKKWFTLAENVF